MKPRILLLWIFLLVGLSRPDRMFAQHGSSVAKKAMTSVVMLQVFDGTGRPVAQGSGFFVRSDIIATNYHVIKNAASATVRVGGSPSLHSVEGIFALDEANDLALLKVKGLSGPP